jgi:hypothetical protein
VALDWLHDKTDPAISGIELAPFPSKTILDNHKRLFNNLSVLVVVLYALNRHGRKSPGDYYQLKGKSECGNYYIPL